MIFKCRKQIFKILLLNIIIFQTTIAIPPNRVPMLSKAARKLSILKLPSLSEQPLYSTKQPPCQTPSETFSYRGICFKEKEIPNESKSINSLSLTKLNFINQANRNHVISLNILTTINSDKTTTSVVTHMSIPIESQIYEIKIVKEMITPNPQYCCKYTRRYFIQSCLEKAIDTYLEETNPLDEWDTPQELERPQFPY